MNDLHPFFRSNLFWTLPEASRAYGIHPPVTDWQQVVWTRHPVPMKLRSSATRGKSDINEAVRLAPAGGNHDVIIKLIRTLRPCVNGRATALNTAAAGDGDDGDVG